MFFIESNFIKYKNVCDICYQKYILLPNTIRIPSLSFEQDKTHDWKNINETEYECEKCGLVKFKCTFHKCTNYLCCEILSCDEKQIKNII